MGELLSQILAGDRSDGVGGGVEGAEPPFDGMRREFAVEAFDDRASELACLG
jgi:hypothetical protein